MARHITDLERERELQAFVSQARAYFDKTLQSRSLGKPATFDQIESSAMEVGLKLARQLMQHEVAMEEGEEAEAAPCPRCQRSCPRSGPIQKRDLLTEAGQVEFARRGFYCKPCRKSFFPSGSGFGSRD
jgi:hypothetical protein